MIINKLIKIALVGLLFVSIASCKKEEPLGSSIFDTNDNLDPNSETYTFDVWLRESYLTPYNLDFKYKMQDVSSDMSYNLVPVSLAKAQDIAKLVKYLWFDAYGAVVGPEFLKENGPRIIHLIGSPAYNPNSGTILLGTAEGGIKVTLFNCNNLNPNNVNEMNEFYFKTMHHEFAHILHQKKSYPVEFGLFSLGKYNPLGWQDMSESEAASKGFVSPYASSESREDFVEIIANYIVKTDADWNAILDMASKNGIPDDGIDGKAIILQKLAMAKLWLQDSWNLDLEKLRNEIKTRQTKINEILK